MPFDALNEADKHAFRIAGDRGRAAERAQDAKDLVVEEKPTWRCPPNR